MYDVAVVGARCAGSPTAMLLARKGYRVLLVDKAVFPSETISTHFIHAPGVARLKRWGLLDKVVASNCPPVHSYRLDFGLFSLQGSPPPVDGVATAYAPRRAVLDKILVDGAAEAGAELRESFGVQEVYFEDGRAAGIRGRTRNGTSVTDKALLIIGADGLHSSIARMVGAAIDQQKPAVACAYYTYWSGVSVEGVELYPRDHRIAIAFPTNDNLVCTFMEWPREEFHIVRADVEGQCMKTLKLIPGLEERIRNGTRAERFLRSGDLPNFFRKAHGPGWPWSATPAVTRTRMGHTESATRSGMLSGSQTRSIADCPGANRWRRRLRSTSVSAMNRRCQPSSSISSWQLCSRLRLRCRSYLGLFVVTRWRRIA